MMFSQEIADRICERLAAGEGSLRAICVSQGMSHSTWLDWVKERPDLADQYARAREIGQSTRFEGLNEKAATEPERDDKGRVDPGWVSWMKMQIDTEKWTLSKQEPKKYGDKLELAGNGEAPLIVQVMTVTTEAERASAWKPPAK